MSSSVVDLAIQKAQLHGSALLKFISPNDTGETGSHQCGYYLPKREWRLFSPKAPKKGDNFDHFVEIIWQDERITKSCVKWYGQKTRSEFRLTRFGRAFPWLTTDNIGNLLVLIPDKDVRHFYAYVLENDDDIEYIQAALGIQVIGPYAVYSETYKDYDLSGNLCISSAFEEFIKLLKKFPPTEVFSNKTQEAVLHCIESFPSLAYDDQIMKLLEYEYKLFRLAEIKLCANQIFRKFKDVDDFLKTASSILNRRKSRAGKSFENQVSYILDQARIPYTKDPNIEGRPDFIIPNEKAYYNSSFPSDKIIILGAKTTCKDRWRQITKEAPRIPCKHLITIQKGISAKQLQLMLSANITPVVPKSLHVHFQRATRGSILSIVDFINQVKQRLS